jgi:hypothetical protein
VAHFLWARKAYPEMPQISNNRTQYTKISDKQYANLNAYVDRVNVKYLDLSSVPFSLPPLLCNVLL